MKVEDLKRELKQLVMDECDCDGSADDITNDEQLLGENSQFGLDSLDALAISLEIKSRYGKHIDSGNEARAALTSINTLANFILGE